MFCGNHKFSKFHSRFCWRRCTSQIGIAFELVSSFNRHVDKYRKNMVENGIRALKTTLPAFLLTLINFTLTSLRDTALKSSFAVELRFRSKKSCRRAIYLRCHEMNSSSVYNLGVHCQPGPGNNVRIPVSKLVMSFLFGFQLALKTNLDFFEYCVEVAIEAAFLLWTRRSHSPSFALQARMGSQWGVWATCVPASQKSIEESFKNINEVSLVQLKTLWCEYQQESLFSPSSRNRASSSRKSYTRANILSWTATENGTTKSHRQNPSPCTDGKQSRFDSTCFDKVNNFS